MRVEPLKWKNRSLWILDQTLLPVQEKWIRLRDVEAVWEAIRSLRVRGAPLIGVIAAYGVVVAALGMRKTTVAELIASVNAAIDRLASARPTAVNLFWALERMRGLLAHGPWKTVAQLCDALEKQAVDINMEDLESGKRIGDNGWELLRGKQTVLTHCNAGVLATSGYGTALAPVYRAVEHGQSMHVFVDETRPLLQGSRLTAWELMKAGIPMTLICDNMAAAVFSRRKVDAVIVGADRIAANGDTANKIGTYGVAVLAKAHKIPFYVAAPLSTIDRKIPSGKSIPIEERAVEEVTMGFGKQTAPKKVHVFSPAFDVTPASLIDAIITEVGVLRPAYTSSIKRAFQKNAKS